MDDGNMGTVDTTPRKRILWTSVAVCSPKNAITELQDNIIDFVVDRLKQKKLNKSTIKSSFDLTNNGITIKWNLGIPAERRLALLTPGLHISDDDETVGTWSLGGKIAMHALGDDITIRTCAPDDDSITIYRYPSGWLRNSNGEYNEDTEKDWTVQKHVETIEDNNDFTEIIIKNPSSDVKKNFNRNQQESYDESMNRVLEYVGETYGLTFEQMHDNITFDMNINGTNVKPITYSSRNDLKNNLVRVPGFEPTWHKYSMNGLKIKVLVGCTAKVESAQAGIYFYGNHNRLFARRERNPDYLSGIGDITHPNKKHWQMHIFFSGNTELIPWSSPLKDGINYDHVTMQMLKPILNKLPLPYIELVSRTGAGTRYIFSEEYLKLSDDDKKDNVFGSNPKGYNLWNTLPKIVKLGREYSDEIIEEYDHGDLILAHTRKTDQVDPKWTRSLANSFFRSSQITQTNNQTIEGKIKALWKFNTYIDPTENNHQEVKPKKDSIENMQTSINPSNTSRFGSVKVDDAVATTKKVEDYSGTLPMDKTPFSPEPIDRNETEVISARVQKGDVTRLRIAAHSTKPTDVMNFLVDLFYQTQKLFASPNMPEKISSKNGMKDKMEALISHFDDELKE